MIKKSGIRAGALWGIILFLFYIYAYFGFGIYKVWNISPPHKFLDWIVIIGSSFGYILIGVIGLIPVLLISLYLIFRDRDLIGTVTKHWPIIFAVIYPMIPNIPGPFDEIIVGGICISLEFWFASRSIRRQKNEDVKIIDGVNYKIIK